MHSSLLPPRRNYPAKKPAYRPPSVRPIPIRRPIHSSDTPWKWFFIGGTLLALLLLTAGTAILVWAMAG